MAERDEVVVVWDLAEVAAASRGLEEECRIAIADRGLEQPLRVRCRRRRQDVDAAQVHDHRVGRVGVLGCAAAARAVAGDDRDRQLHLATGHQSQLRHLIGDRVHPGEEEVGEHHVQHRPVAGRRQPTAMPVNVASQIGELRTPARTELGMQAADVTEDRELDVLPVEHHLRIALHLLDERVVDCFDQSPADHVVLRLRAGEHHTLGERWVGRFAGVGGSLGGVDDLSDRSIELGERGLVGDALCDEQRGESVDRVLRPATRRFRLRRGSDPRRG